MKYNVLEIHYTQPSSMFFQWKVKQGSLNDNRIKRSREKKGLSRKSEEEWGSGVERKGVQVYKLPWSKWGSKRDWILQEDEGWWQNLASIREQCQKAKKMFRIKTRALTSVDSIDHDPFGIEITLPWYSSQLLVIFTHTPKLNSNKGWWKPTWKP